MCGNIPAKPTYGVYGSQLIKICDTSCVLARHRLLTERLDFGIDYACLRSLPKDILYYFNKYAVSVRNHIMKGICIPLDVRRDLVSNVTIWRRGQCA